MKLRPYQEEAIAAVFDYWADADGSPLIDLATGTGKSLVMAELMRSLCADYTDMRLLCVTHVQELIEQNYLELLRIWPFAPAGIYSAGLGRRDTRYQIIFAGIQSAHSKARAFGPIDLLMIDEAHLIPIKANTMYGRFIADMRALNPDMKVLGLTATPYRLNSGRLDEGKDRLFDKVVYTYGIADGVRDGYLARLATPATQTGFDLTGVAKSGGDYLPGQLQAACDKAEITRRAIDEVIAYGKDRRSWLAFCSGVDHALHVRDEIRSRGFSCETVTGDTPKDERRRILADFKAGKVRAITNNSVLTTGFNAPSVDLIAALRPSKSASLYVQIGGRGTRPVYKGGMALDTADQRLASIAASSKINCLFLDFAGLIDEHGPIDCVNPKAPGGGGPAPVKECPNCHYLINASLMICPDCGHIFPPSGKTDLTAKASSMAIMASAPPEWLRVTERTFAKHEKPERPPSVLTKYRCGFVTHKNWLCPEHEGKAKGKAHRYWSQHGGKVPFPITAEEWLARAGELRGTAEICVKPDGKYIEVVDARPIEGPDGLHSKRADPMAVGMLRIGIEKERDRAKANQPWTPGGIDLSDDIPF